MKSYKYFVKTQKKTGKLEKGEIYLLLSTLSLCNEDVTEEKKERAFRVTTNYLRNRGVEAGSVDEMMEALSSALIQA